MSFLEAVTGRIGRARSEGPSTYRCEECGREFEVDAPPGQAACGECLNDEVTLVEA